MEIDVREGRRGEPIRIRFGEEVVNVISKYSDDHFQIGVLGDFYTIRAKHIPNLIKALKKYQELYGEE